MKTGILGGGLTGLSLSYFLKCESEILEKNKKGGGLCSSFTKNGFTFDYGGHIIFSKDKEVLNFMISILGDNVEKHYRNNKVWYKRRFVKYPFENGLYALPKEDIFECLYYYINNDHPKPTNLKEWLYYTFGKGIAEKYLIPYNEKIWNTELETMGIDWVERIPKPPLEDVIKSAVGIETEGYTHQLYFYYPIKDGIQSLIESIQGKVSNITTNFEVKKISKDGDKWIVSNGSIEKVFDKIVSTIPIFDLLNALNDVPEDVKIAANNLRYNSLIVVMVGINDADLSDKTAVYIPDKRCLFHRICFNKYFSESLVPNGKSSVMAEITANIGDDVWELTDKEITKKVVSSLSEEDFINEVDVCETDVKRAKYAYIIHDLNHSKNMKIISNFLESIGIEICGRFSEFKYLNMDACIRSAMNMAKKLNDSINKIE